MNARRLARLRLHVEQLEDRFTLAGDGLIGLTGAVSLSIGVQSDTAPVHVSAHADGQVANHSGVSASTSVSAERVDAALARDLELGLNENGNIRGSSNGSASVTSQGISAELADAVATQFDNSSSATADAVAGANGSATADVTPLPLEAPIAAEPGVAGAAEMSEEANGAISAAQALPNAEFAGGSGAQMSASNAGTFSPASIFPFDPAALGASSISGPVTPASTGVAPPVSDGDGAVLGGPAPTPFPVVGAQPESGELAPVTPLAAPIPPASSPQSGPLVPTSGASSGFADGVGTSSANLIDPNSAEQRALVAARQNEPLARNLAAVDDQIATQ